MRGEPHPRVLRGVDALMARTIFCLLAALISQSAAVSMLANHDPNFIIAVGIWMLCIAGGLEAEMKIMRWIDAVRSKQKTSRDWPKAKIV